MEKNSNPFLPKNAVDAMIKSWMVGRGICKSVGGGGGGGGCKAGGYCNAAIVLLLVQGNQTHRAAACSP